MPDSDDEDDVYRKTKKSNTKTKKSNTKTKKSPKTKKY